jgi:hypothetical protein
MPQDKSTRGCQRNEYSPENSRHVLFPLIDKILPESTMAHGIFAPPSA